MAAMNRGSQLMRQCLVFDRSLYFQGKGAIYRSTVAAPNVSVDPKLSENSDTNQDVWHNDLSNTLPYSQVPHQKGPPVLLTFVNTLKNKGKMHTFHQANFKRFGPIYKELILGKYHFVYICDKDSIERLHRLEGKYPLRLIMEPWKNWREKKGHALGILISEGLDWKRMRSSLDKQMLRPKQVANFADDMNEVVTEFMARLRHVRQDDMSVKNMNEELFNWSLETIGTVLYEKRLNAFSSNEDKELKQFILAVHNMFMTTDKVTHMPEILKKTFGKKWLTMHEDAWDVIFTTGKKFIDEKLLLIQKKMDNNEEVSGFLSNLLASQKMSVEEVYANVSELMAASVDTTSNTMQWCLYELSRYPQYQEKLLEEQISVLGDRRIASYNDLQQMPLLKSIVKEILRLYPVAAVITRTLTEDFNLCGYRIPTGTHIIGSSYTLGRDPSHYDDPESFRPERWLRSDHQNVHTFAWLPFGHGPRMCVGKRVAELELHLLLARFIREFVIEKADDEELRIKTKGLLIPEKSVALRLIDRQ